MATAKLIYVTNASVDGYIEDEGGGIDWSPPSDEVFAFMTELTRPIVTYLYGRRLYESMAVWETDSSFAAQSTLAAKFAGVWQTAEKVVYSSSLDAPSTRNTRIERSFEPSQVRAMKQSGSGDLSVGGAVLAAQALAAGLIDEYHLFIRPVLVGAGKPALRTEVLTSLGLIESRTFDDGSTYLRYDLRS